MSDPQNPRRGTNFEPERTRIGNNSIVIFTDAVLIASVFKSPMPRRRNDATTLDRPRVCSTTAKRSSTGDKPDQTLLVGKLFGDNAAYGEREPQNTAPWTDENRCLR